MKSHSIAPDGSPALHDHQRAAGDIGQRRERLGGGDGGGDGDGVDDRGNRFRQVFWDMLESILFLIKLIRRLHIIDSGYLPIN